MLTIALLLLGHQGAETGTIQGDVVVYGATAAGCAAAIAASRSGAQRVVLATPYKHVGGMTTGGIMHADVGNESTIYGIAREYFERVVSHYPQKPPHPHKQATYGCVANRCVELDPTGREHHGGGSADPTCAGKCVPLAAQEWLAVNFLSTLSNQNRTLTVSLPAGQNSSFIKKGEPLAHEMLPNMSKQVQQGEMLYLARPATIFDNTYYLIELQNNGRGFRVGRHSKTLSILAEHTPPYAGAPPPHAGAPPGWLYESHVAERVFEEMLAEANVTIVRELVGLASVTKQGTAIHSFTSESGVELIGHVFIDGSYEGDLAFAAEASMVWGRESTSQYNEPDAGRRPASIAYKNVDPYWADGTVIPHVSAQTPVPVGHADNRIEVYDFRLCVTNSPSHRLPFWKPQNYNASEWEFWRRLYSNKPPQRLSEAGLGCLGPIPNNYSDCDGPCVKCDMLGMKHGTDMLNGAWNYPNASTAQRKAIRKSHIDYTLGLLWFWATDPATSEALHDEMAELGLCTDEYLDGEDGDPPHWPYQLYVREARRLVGDFVWTEHDPSAALRNRSIGLGAYSFDCHWVSLYIEQGQEHTKDQGDTSAAQTAFVAAEGRVNSGHEGEHTKGVLQAPFEIPYDVLLPQAAEVTNLLVPVAASMSHVRFNALRMEPVWMIMAHGAGAASAMALRAGINVHNVDVAKLQNLLSTQKQKLWP